MTIASINEYRALARRGLPHFLFEYLDGGSYGEVTLRRNIADLESVATPAFKTSIAIALPRQFLPRRRRPNDTKSICHVGEFRRGG
jgi:hypothetical protein